MSEQNYSQQAPGGYLDKLVVRKRHEMFEIFMEEFPAHTTCSILDAGVTADKNALSSNYFEKHYPHKNKIIAISNQDAAFLEDIYPGLTFKLGDALQLPFPDNSIDVVISSAVIEHVGALSNQKKLLAEAFRVAKSGVFLTTPNRWYPLEIHTLLPLLHWLPKSWHRACLKILGMHFYADENNLNLLDAKTLKRLCKEIGAKNFYIRKIRLLGFACNYLLIIRKGEGSSNEKQGNVISTA